MLSLLQAKKISLPYARELVLQSCHNVQRLLKELDIIERELAKERTAAAVSSAEGHLARQRKAWRSVPAVQQWHEQYMCESFRYKFLVLEGPSKLGKTQFAKSFVDSAEQLLELIALLATNRTCAASATGTTRSCSLTRFAHALWRSSGKCPRRVQRKRSSVAPQRIATAARSSSSV